MKGLKILATGRSVPEKVVTNADMTKIVDTNDEWIVTRTGIRERRHCTTERTSTLAIEAARRAVERAGISPDEIGACVVCTVSPDTYAPTIGCLIQKALGLREDTICFDLNVGCTGFIYGFHVVRGLLLQSDRPYALLLGAESLSKVTDFSDRSTCVLFGDGAGAVLLSQSDDPYHCTLGVRGNDRVLTIAGQGQGEPSVIRMDGQAVFRFAVEAIPKSVHTLLQEANLSLDDISWFIPHQANRRIAESAAKRLGVPLERFYLNMDHYGNTSAASIPLALDEMAEQGLLQQGQKFICVGFGAGLTWGGILLEW